MATLDALTQGELKDELFKQVNCSQKLSEDLLAARERF